MIRFTILGQPVAKSNAHRIVKMGKRHTIAKSAEAYAYERSAVLQIPHHAKQMLQGRIRMTVRLYYRTELPDMDESIILDVLQTKFTAAKDGPRRLIRKGCYLNDRQVRERHVYHFVDAKNPRAEIELEQIEAELPLLLTPDVLIVPENEIWKMTPTHDDSTAPKPF